MGGGGLGTGMGSRSAPPPGHLELLSFRSDPQQASLAQSHPEPPRTKSGGTETPREMAEETRIAGKVLKQYAGYGELRGAQIGSECWLHASRLLCGLRGDTWPL